MCIRSLLAVVCFAVATTAGCGGSAKSDSEAKAPRPVSVFSLKRSDPATLQRVAGTVASWKTENVGFEVAGRVQFVIEPETEVALGEDSSDRGTVLARLDDTRYRLQVRSIQSKIQSKQKLRDSTLIEVEKVLPAQELVADSELRLAKLELDRRDRLLKQDAISQEEFDKAKSDWEKADAAVIQLAAQKEAKRADVASIEADIQQLNESLAEANRDVDDCVLYAPYRGQVADIHVIAGAYVERGQPVVTVQMMDPIAVEFEVSAETARRLNYRDLIDIYMAQPDDSWRQGRASVYMTDPVADPETRTFTATLLGRNGRTRATVPEDMKGKPIVRTDNIWKLLSEILGTGEVQYIEENAIHEDDEGAFLWKITNRNLGSVAGQINPKLDVAKLRVTRGEQKLPFLGGIWTFQEIKVNEGEPFDPATEIVTGKLTFPPKIELASFDGGTVLFDRERWLMRPGDIVRVDLSGGATRPGFYVPVNAILEKSGQNSVFSVEASEDADRVRQVKVKVFEAVDTLRRIEAEGSEPLKEGMSIVADGALFLNDGETVNVAREVEVRR